MVIISGDSTFDNSLSLKIIFRVMAYRRPTPCSIYYFFRFSLSQTYGYLCGVRILYCSLLMVLFLSAIVHIIKSDSIFL